MMQSKSSGQIFRSKAIPSGDESKLNCMTQESDSSCNVQDLNNSEHSLKAKMKKFEKKSPQRTLVEIFKGNKFTFVPYGLILTQKRIQILGENIRKRGGAIIPYSEFSWSSSRDVGIDIIVTKQMPYQALKQIVPAIFHQEIFNYRFTDCEWLTACLQKNEIVNIESYCIEWKEENPFENENVREDMGCGMEIENLTEHNSNVRQANLQKQEKIETNTGLHIALDKNLSSLKVIDLSGQSDEEKQQLSPQMDVIKDEISANILKEESQIVIKTETRPKLEVKSEFLIKREARIKQETAIKNEEKEGDKRNFTYILADDDDEITFIGKTQKKVKFEEEDIKGTFLEDVSEIDKINTTKEGEVIELKYFKPWKGIRSTRRTDKQRENGLRNGRKEIFICELGMKQNLNAHITDEFEKLLNAYEVLRDEGRKKAYDKIISVIKTFPKKIENADEIKGIYSLGPKIVKKVHEILTTGKLRRAENLHNDEKVKVLELFNSVWGIGPTTAERFYKKGFRTLEDLKNNPDQLTDWQKAGLKYHKDFLTKVPRETVAEIFKIIEDKIEELSTCKKEYEAVCGGSYRRGRILCNDVDIVLCRRDEKSIIGFLAKLAKSLEGTLFTDHLSWPKPEVNGGETYMGVCYYNGIYHRIDIKSYPREQFGAAVQYFTGSEYFNRSIRLFAKRKGLNLENYGLYPAIRVKKDKFSFQCIPCYTEEDVFRNLGLKFIPPHERDI